MTDALLTLLLTRKGGMDSYRSPNIIPNHVLVVGFMSFRIPSFPTDSSKIMRRQRMLGLATGCSHSSDMVDIMNNLRDLSILQCHTSQGIRYLGPCWTSSANSSAVSHLAKVCFV